MSHVSKLLVICCVLAAGAAGAQSKPVYKWTDDQGVVHFSESAPDSVTRQVEKMEIQTGTAANAEDMASPPDGDSAVQQAIAVDLVAECAKARKNLQVLDTYTNINDYDAQGNATQLTEEQKTARRESTQTYIDQYCQNS